MGSFSRRRAVVCIAYGRRRAAAKASCASRMAPLANVVHLVLEVGHHVVWAITAIVGVAHGCVVASSMPSSILPASSSILPLRAQP